jgi:glycogen operon protein
MAKHVPTIWPGKPYPLGATYDGKGVNFALYSENAQGVELCLFDSQNPAKQYPPIEMTEQTAHVWHTYIPGLKPGQLYGYRVYGEYNPKAGLRFNSGKVLLDPYAKAIQGMVQWHDSMYSYPMNWKDPNRDLVMNTQDNAAYTMKSVVVDTAFDWSDDVVLDTPLHASVIYEVHAKGFTMTHPDIDPKIRGTYSALCSEPALEYFRKLGITAIELMPIHQFVHDDFLAKKGLRNYWGYNTIGFFAPHNGYSSMGDRGGQVNEFKQMVKTLHQNGIEVIMDVVYNHTAEGNHFGPHLCFKGIDNQSYYRLVYGNPRMYMDYTGTGNTLNVLNSHALQLITDSLRYWVSEMHVDGFRFDLASTLARGEHEVGKMSAFLEIVHQDPVISQVKLIAEPWDVGEGGYQVGNFPVLWAEWNGKYRDNVRKFWRGDEGQMSELAYRLTGSSDLYKSDGRSPGASINFITAHDGFTLNDLVSYNEKHNLNNGEENRDGESHNNSWNCGAEGATKDKKIIELRERQRRNMLATLLLSQGVPMIVYGDECGRTQQGNNNTYCQDNEIGWMNWDWTTAQQQFFDFTRLLIQIRRENPVLHRRKFFQGRPIKGAAFQDIYWFRPDGQIMSESDWQASYSRCIGMFLNGQMMDDVDEKGIPIKDDIILVLLNAYWDALDFKIPDVIAKKRTDWEVLIDTSQADQPNGTIKLTTDTYKLQARSVVLLRYTIFPEIFYTAEDFNK